MERKTRARGAAVLVALGSLVAALLVMAAPASAEKSGGAFADDTSTASGGCVAVNGSVCSGDGLAANGSTSSGDAIAVDGSVASGCSAAFNGSTASGGSCPKPAHKAVEVEKKKKGPAPGQERAAVRQAPTARPTAATELAFTGSSTGPLAAAGALALALGLVLVALTSERRRSLVSS